MRLHQKFKNVHSYACGIEKWVKDFYKEVSGRTLTMTFPMDFAIADWYDKASVIDTYKRIKAEWLKDYKAWTEVCISLSYLSYANDQLEKQGIEGRESFIELYSKLFNEAHDAFYEHYKDNEEAQDYFFEWTD